MKNDISMTEEMKNQKAAFVAIVGRPNVGKSSILNKLVGQKIAIVSKKPQTTRTRIIGVMTRDEGQLVFVDTPGLIKPKNALGKYMVKSVVQSVTGVDACMLVVEAGKPVSNADMDLIERFRKEKMPAILALNKIDKLADKSLMMKQISDYTELYDFKAYIPVSAKTGDGMSALLEELFAFPQEGGYFFPEDALTDQPERVIAAEIVREKLLRLLGEEIPHGTAAVTETMKERSGIMDIDITIFCERANHKGIIIGKGGAMLKKIGTAAREDMEKFLGCKVNLQLWVKVKEDWRQRPETLHRFGFDERKILE
jgi:GTP-binding protein Era